MPLFLTVPATTPASITGQLTDSIGHHGLYAVFLLMAFDALVPLGGELIMLYAGVIAAGAIAGQDATLFGVTLPSGAESYLALALAGSLGSQAGCLIGWGIGARGGRTLIERHGRWLHLSPPALRRAEEWFRRYGSRAVLLARVTPVARSFISIPAGALGSPLPSFTALTLVGSLVWCFGFAGVGWAVGASWPAFHHSFRYADYAAVAAITLLLAAAATVHRRGSAVFRPR